MVMAQQVQAVLRIISSTRACQEPVVKRDLHAPLVVFAKRAAASERPANAAPNALL